MELTKGREIMLTVFGSKKAESTSLSDFVKNASSSHKKHVYGIVVKNATESQRQILREAKED